MYGLSEAIDEKGRSSPRRSAPSRGRPSRDALVEEPLHANENKACSASMLKVVGQGGQLERMTDRWQRVRVGSAEPSRRRGLPFERAGRHMFIAARKNIGKVVLVP